MALILVLIACAVVPATAWAEPPARVVRIATVGSEPTPVWDVFQQRLRELGYIEGHNLVLERRWTHGFTERVPGLVSELLGLKPEVLVTSMLPPAPSVDPMLCAPILAIGVAEPYGRCAVFPVARKSLTAAAMDLSATHLEVAHAILPAASRFVVVTNSGQRFLVDYVRGLERGAQSHGLSVSVIDLVDEPDPVAALARQAPDAIILAPAFGAPSLRKQLVQYATRRRIPAVGAHLADGVVVAVDYDWLHLGRRAADLVDGVVNGVRAAALPVDSALELEVIVDRRAAATLGLTLPAALLSQADRVLD